MSYRNPNISIQRGAGESIQRLQDSLTRTGVNLASAVAKQAKERADKAAANALDSRNYYIKNQSALAEPVSQLQKQFGVPVENQLREIVDIGSQYKTEQIPSIEGTRYMSDVAKLPAFISNVGEATVSLSETTKENMRNLGEYGGYDKFQPSGNLERAMIIGGALPSRSSSNFSVGGPNGLNAEFTYVGKNGSYTMTGQEAIALNEDPNGQLGFVIPNEGERQLELWQSTVLKKGANAGDVNAFADEFYKPGFVKKYIGKGGDYEMVKELDSEKIKAAMFTSAKANVESLNGIEQISLYNKFAESLGQKEYHLDYEKVLSEDEVKKLTERYIDTTYSSARPEESTRVTTGKDVADKSSSSKAAKDKISQDEDANRLANDIYNATEKRNSNYFVGKSYKGKEIQGAEFTSDGKLEIIYNTGRTVKEEVKNDEGKMVEERKAETMSATIDTKNPDSMGNLFNRFAIGEYGTDAGGENIRDIGNPIIKDLVDKRKGRNRFASGFGG